MAALLAGACLIALAGCTDDAEDVTANGVVQAQTSSDSTPAPATEAPAAAEDVAPAAGADAATTTAAAADAPPPSGSADVAALMEQGPLEDIVIGDPDAPVTIIEYASMTCGHCANFHTETYPGIKANYIDTGKAKLIIREFPFDPRALAAFMLARCTNDDEKRTAMIDVLFQQQDQWARAENASEALLNIAKLAGFSQESFTACLNDKELQQNIVEAQERAQTEFDVNATPTFFVNGDKYSGALGLADMSAVIEAHL